jgi:CheY-like chemotaxis protein
VILLDLVMPDKNGYDVCEALRADANLKGVPIILLAGTFESYDHERGKRVGANDFVTKPFESQALVSKVKQALFARTLGGAPSAGTPPPTLSLDEDTLKIPSVAVKDRVAATPPAKESPIPALSQDDLWQLLEAPETSQPKAQAPPPPTPAEISLDELTQVAPSVGAGIADLDLGLLESAPATPAPSVPSAPAADGLSLDDLLGGPAPVAAAPAEPAAVPPTIELPEDDGLPPLAMVEAGKAEPAAFSIDDLLEAPEATAPAAPAAPPQAAPAELPPLEIPELELGSVQAEEQPATVLAEPSPAASAGDAAEISLEELGIPPEPAPEPARELTAVLGVPETSEVAAEDAVAAAVPVVPPPASAAAAGLPPAAVGEMAQAVTKRVAEELTQELRNSLIERVEKIVWEVVPDLAEILITKEIERIRRQAEEDTVA